MVPTLSEWGKDLSTSRQHFFFLAHEAFLWPVKLLDTTLHIKEVGRLILFLCSFAIWMRTLHTFDLEMGRRNCLTYCTLDSALILRLTFATIRVEQ
jgi:hypothetical protein